MSTFLSGVIEGFYGPPWGYPERQHLIHMLKKRKLNTYVYAPKNDEKHLKNWRDVYDSQQIEQMATLIKTAEENGIQFVFALSPGKDICYSREEDFECLWNKLTQIVNIGCKSFGLFFDDVSMELVHEADKNVFSSLSEAQVSLCNRVYTSFGPGINRFIVCPTVYCDEFVKGTLKESQYLTNFGSSLKLGIDFFWTGPSVISTELSLDLVNSVMNIMKRKPIIWDNLFANDYDPVNRLFMGPYSRRSSDLKKLNGVLINPNCQCGANFIPLFTFASWVSEPSYNPSEALQGAIQEWIAEFKESYANNKGTVVAKATEHDVRFMVEIFYLPFVYSDSAAELVDSVRYLLQNPNKEDPAVYQQKRQTFQKAIEIVDKLTTAISLSTENQSSRLSDLYSTIKKLQLILYHLDSCLQSPQTNIIPATADSNSVVEQLRVLLPADKLQMVNKIPLPVRTSRTEKAKQ